MRIRVRVAAFAAFFAVLTIPSTALMPAGGCVGGHVCATHQTA
jgi:hypothetical protein